MKAAARRNRAAIAISVVGIGAIYWLAALTNGKTLRPVAAPAGFHALIAEAIVRGHLDVAPAPPDLLNLPDPYDAAANATFRSAGYHDLALYRGRLYTATGPTTGIVVYLPARLVGVNMNPSLGTLLCALGGFIASVGVFNECRRRYFPGLRPWQSALALVGLGLGSPALWLVAIGRAYENAIACGYLLVALGGYLLVRGLRDPGRPVKRCLTGAAVALAAAVGARPHLALAGMFVAASAAVIVRAGRKNRRRSLALLSLVGPYVVVGAAVGLYNYARFDSFTEFGTRYQLAGMNMPAYPLYHAEYLPPNLFDYILRPPRLEPTWPFVHLAPSTSTGNPRQHEREPIAGILTLYPFMAVGLLAGLTRFRSLARRAPGLAAMIVLASALGVLGVVAVSMPFNASTMRYTVDFAPPLALAAVLAAAWMLDHHRAVNRSGWSGFAVLWTGAVILSAVMGTALVLTPCRGTGSC